MKGRKAKGLCPLDPRRRAAAVLSAARLADRGVAKPKMYSGFAKQFGKSRAALMGVWGNGPSGSRAEPWPSSSCHP
jgi:hypothetical protein